jgi:thiol:disulfide interchange protein DsbD
MIDHGEFPAARPRDGAQLLATLYLLGMAAMYSTLGLIAALTGSLFGSALQNPIVLGVIALVMVGLALSMFGLYDIRVPTRLAGVAGTAKQGTLGSFLMGLTVGIVAAPCIGPFVLGLLTFVGETANPLLGFSLLRAAPADFPSWCSRSRLNITRLRSGEWMDGAGIRHRLPMAYRARSSATRSTLRSWVRCWWWAASCWASCRV